MLIPHLAMGEGLDAARRRTQSMEEAMAVGSAGHRSVTHQSDIELEAWAPTCERCLTEAVDALADCFVVPPRPQPSELVEWTHLDNDPENLLGYLLDWVVYHRRVFGRVPVTTDIERSSEWDLRFETADIDGSAPTEHAPESIYVRGISVRSEPDGWHCQATLDISTESAELACTPAPETTPRIQGLISQAARRTE
jgi:SHS2 domain-containing protein